MFMMWKSRNLDVAIYQWLSIVCLLLISLIVAATSDDKVPSASEAITKLSPRIRRTHSTLGYTSWTRPVRYTDCIKRLEGKSRRHMLFRLFFIKTAY